MLMYWKYTPLPARRPRPTCLRSQRFLPSNDVESSPSVAETVRLDHAGPDTENDEQDQQHRQTDAARERLQGAIGLTLVGHHEIQAGAQVVDDQDQKRDDGECGPHGRNILAAVP